MYMKPRKRTVKDMLLEKSMGIENKKEVELVEDRNATKTYSRGLKMRFGTLFAVCSLTIAFIAYIGLQGLLEFQAWNEDYYLARHQLIETKGENGYKSSSFKVTVNRPLTIEKQPDRTVYMPVASDGNEIKLVVNKPLTQEEKESIVNKSGYSKILRGIWMLETNKGGNTNQSAHHNECSKVGMTNEFGYRALDDYCFETFEDSVERVTEWFDGELKTKSLNSALCYYATGKATSTCNYAISFVKLDQDGKLASN